MPCLGCVTPTQCMAGVRACTGGITNIIEGDAVDVAFKSCANCITHHDCWDKGECAVKRDGVINAKGGPSDGLEPWRDAAESARKTAAELLRIAGGMAKASSVLLVTQRPDHAQRIPFLGYREVLAACDFLLEARMSLLEAAQEFEAV